MFQAPKVENAPCTACSDLRELGRAKLRPSVAKVRADHRELAQLLIKGHGLNETLDPCRFRTS